MSLTPVCQTCLEAIRPIDGPRCAVCGERLMSRHLMPEPEGTQVEDTRAGACATDARATPPLCGMCLQNAPAFTRASAYGSYDAGLRDLVHLLKYERVKPAANVLGRMLAEVVADLAEAFGPESPVVLPVPLHASKMRQRGFNQSELIARAMLKLKPAALDAKLNTTALVRSRATESQTGLTPPQRRENMRGAFKVVRRDQISGRDILLIDDVFTTGTTVSECARVLRRAGAERVFVATVARVLKPEAERVEPEFEEPRAMSAHA
jgi:ComF family protein